MDERQLDSVVLYSFVDYAIQRWLTSETGRTLYGHLISKIVELFESEDLHLDVHSGLITRVSLFTLKRIVEEWDVGFFDAMISNLEVLKDSVPKSMEDIYGRILADVRACMVLNDLRDADPADPVCIRTVYEGFQNAFRREETVRMHDLECVFKIDSDLRGEPDANKVSAARANIQSFVSNEKSIIGALLHNLNSFVDEFEKQGAGCTFLEEVMFDMHSGYYVPLFKRKELKKQTLERFDKARLSLSAIKDTFEGSFESWKEFVQNRPTLEVPAQRTRTTTTTTTTNTQPQRGVKRSMMDRHDSAQEVSWSEDDSHVIDDNETGNMSPDDMARKHQRMRQSLRSRVGDLDRVRVREFPEQLSPLRESHSVNSTKSRSMALVPVQRTMRRSIGNVVGIRKQRKLWTPSETRLFLGAVQKHGVGNWAAIRDEINIDRTNVQLKDRWRTLSMRAAQELGRQKEEIEDEIVDEVRDGDGGEELEEPVERSPPLTRSKATVKESEYSEQNDDEVEKESQVATPQHQHTVRTRSSSKKYDKSGNDHVVYRRKRVKKLQK